MRRKLPVNKRTPMPIETINSCGFGNTIWKKKQRNGANPIAPDPHANAFASKNDDDPDIISIY